MPTSKTGTTKNIHYRIFKNTFDVQNGFYYFLDQGGGLGGGGGVIKIGLGWG